MCVVLGIREPDFEPAQSGGDQLPQCAAAVVAGDVGVPLPPQGLDQVVVGAVRRQEVQPDLAAQLPQHRRDQVRLVDDEVVEDHAAVRAQR